MKKIYTLISILAIGTSAFAQVNARKVNSMNAAENIHVASILKNAKTAAACGPDASDYIFQKEDTASATNANSSWFIDLWPGESISTAYIMDQAALVNGAYVLGRVKPTSSAPTNATVSVYNVAYDGINYIPTTQIGTSTTTSIAATANFFLAQFTTPIAVTDTFAIVVSNNDPLDTLQLIITNYDTPYQEGLSAYDWQGFFEPTLDVIGIDAEFRNLPVVTYDATASFTANNMTICEGETVDFTNTSSSIYENRMFNLNAFDTYWLMENDSTFAWDYGDGTALDYTMDGSHTYATAGTYTATLSAEIEGFIIAAPCVSTQTMSIIVNQCPVGIADINASNLVKASFNNGILTVNTSEIFSTITVIDALGKVVYSENGVNTVKNEINLSDIANGVYFVRVNNENTAKTAKFTVVK